MSSRMVALAATFRYTALRARPTDSGDGTPRTWSGSGDSSHKGPLSGTRILRARFVFELDASGDRGSFFTAAELRQRGR